MRKTWLKEAGITDVYDFFSLEDEAELKGWSDRFASVSAKAICAVTGISTARSA